MYSRTFSSMARTLRGGAAAGILRPGLRERPGLPSLLEAVHDDRGSAPGADRVEHPSFVRYDGRGQRLEVEPPQVRGLLGLHEPRGPRPRRRDEEVVDPLVEGILPDAGPLHRAPR